MGIGTGATNGEPVKPRLVITHDQLTICDHPLAQCRLTQLRRAATEPAEFRFLIRQLASFLVGPVFDTLPVRSRVVQTPLAPHTGCEPAASIVLVPILRAGLGLLDGMLEALPEAVVGHLGLYRNETTLEPVPYYEQLPAGVTGGFVVLLDPMLATGHSAAHALDLLMARKPLATTLATVLASEAGIAEIARRHPAVRVITLAVDRTLNERGYIVPGLGDAGDRYFGTAASAVG